MDLFSDYFNQLTVEVRTRMQRIAELVMEEAPHARPMLKYKMPGYESNGYLIHFAAYKKHIGLYAIPNHHPEFQSRLEAFTTGSGSMQILHTQAIPEALIRDMIRYNLHQNNQKKKAK